MADHQPKLEIFHHDAFDKGLHLLSSLIASSPILEPFAPLEFVAGGGFVSVMYLGNRKAARHLHYFLDQNPFADDYETIRTELKRIVGEVAEQLNYVQDWASDEIQFFLSLHGPIDLFNQSKAQHVVVWQDRNIVIYAVLWVWVLVRKLKRLQNVDLPSRNQDWNDVMAIAKRLHVEGGHSWPLDSQMLCQFDHTDGEPPISQATILEFRRLTLDLHNLDLFPDRQYWIWSGRWSYADHNMGPMPESSWPTRQGVGRKLVWCIKDAKWRTFDFDRNMWVELPPLIPWL